jgi:ankyrin repeat protein
MGCKVAAWQTRETHSAAVERHRKVEKKDQREVWELRLMDEIARKYLENAFSDLLNYDADDLLQPIDPLVYLTPEGDSCLHIAAGRGDLHAVKLLVEAGMDVNLRGDLGNTSLHYARKHAHDDVVQFLISHGALPHLVNELGEKAIS